MSPPPRIARRAALRWAAGASVAALWPPGRSSASAATVAEVLKVQPLGPVPAAELGLLERAVHAFYGFRVERLPVDTMPAAAYYLPRQRYRAEMILDALGRQTPGRILGVTALDISTSKDAHADWGILGLGTIGGRSCVVSSFRCKRRASSPRLPAIRLAKIAVHELGHNLGLQHCPNIGCLMEDANGSVLTCDRDRDLCRRCRDLLAGLGVALPRRRFDWTAGRATGAG